MTREHLKAAVSEDLTAVTVERGVFDGPCPKCGAELLNPGQRFCCACGTNFAACDEPSLDGCTGMLFRTGVSGARVLRDEAGGGQVFMDLPAAGCDGPAGFCPDTDRYVMFTGDGRLAHVKNCPHGQCGRCTGSQADMGCDDLAGWLGFESPDGDVIICAGLCRAAVQPDSSAM